MEQVHTSFCAAPNVPAASGAGGLFPDFATLVGAAPKSHPDTSPSGQNTPASGTAIKNCKRTQAAVCDTGAFLSPSAVPLSGTSPVGQWYTKVYAPEGAYANGSFQEAVAHDEHSAEAILLAEDDAFLLSEERQLLAQANWSRSRASDPTPLLRLNRTDLRALRNSAHLPYALRCSVISFLTRYKRSRWMQWQPNYPERIGISVAAEWENGKAVALCGVNNWLCQHSDFCPRCSVGLRAKPAAREYRDSFQRASFWYAVSPSFELNPNRAGLRYVVQKNDVKKGVPQKMSRFNPYRDREPGEPLTADAHLVDSVGNPVISCFNTVFKLAEALVSSGMAGGVFAHREIAWHFRPHRVTPNGHLLVNTPVPITFEMAKEMLLLFERLYLRQRHGGCLYPDLHIEQMLSQEEITRWIFYMLKPMDYVTGYLRSVQAGVDIAALNLEVDDRIFQGGSKILSARSPRRFGNLRCNADGYIGSGSVTAGRKEQAERRKAERERFGLHKPKPPPAQPRLARVIDRAARIEAEV